MKSSGAVENLFWLDRRWFERRINEDQAARFCRDLARSHYENFTVASLLLPSSLRQHFANVYAYCRVSDDLADELTDPDSSMSRLREWEEHLDRCYGGEAVHPVFVALRSTIREFEIPKQPFADLLVAFRQDQSKVRYDSWEDLLDYCKYSANPVGRLVLYLCGYRDEQRQILSDRTCTALQLTNFWQDVARDYEGGRIYIPLQTLAACGYTEEALGSGVYNESWVELMKHLIGETRSLFREGLQLCSLVRARVRIDIELFTRGGLAVLRGIEAIGYDTLHRRPALTRAAKGRLLLSSLVRGILPRTSGGLP